MRNKKSQNNHLLSIIMLILVSVLLANCSLLRGDKDKDGISNKKDRCPDVAGIKELYGCPDIDGDGITDSEDECPDTPGSQILGGCPDGDGDGIPDKDDQCPELAGPIENYGCPWLDTDGDDVLDKDDRCPDLKGTAANNGCPEITESMQRGFLPPAPTGKEIIIMSNFKNKKNLQGIADKLLQALEIKGYTGNSFYRMNNDGFAIVTQIEQTNKSWKSLAGSDRWVVGPNASVNPERGFFGNLFYPNKGYYRCMIFIVHKNTSIQQASTDATQDILREEFRNGSPYLPDGLGPIKTTGYKVTVFIYQFEKPESEAVGRLLKTSPNPGQNLIITGILKQLQQ
jgi:hypothetical protein